MAEIVLFLIIVILIILVIPTIRSIVKRVYLLIKLFELKRMTGAVIKLRTFPLFSLLVLSKRPEITVEMGDTVYLLRLFSASSAHRRVHFANPEFTVTIKGKRTRSAIAVTGTGTRSWRRSVVKINDYSRPKSGKVRILPKLKTPQKWGYSGKKTVPVLIFNPAPHDVTYVTPEKNKVVAAFTGDTVYDSIIFTASTFVTYVDRQERYKKEARRHAIFGDDYFS